VGFSSLSDIYGFRVIVEAEDDCYRALGVIHRAWPMVPERFKDFISTPKSNNYRSLHTTVVGPGGLRIEMQIRTEIMDRVAEDGVAAHWAYKNHSYGFDREAMEADGGRDPLLNLRHLVQVIEHGEGGEDWVEHAKLEMYLDQVFVFTPKGALITLPRGGMALDFAYAVHTEVGDTAVGVKINGELKPMRTALQNGDVVEIIRGTKREVPTDWRSLTVTGRARSAIRRHIRTSERDEFVRLGKATLEQTLERAGKSLADVKLTETLKTFAIATEEDLFDAIGRGRLAATKIAETIFPALKGQLKAGPERKRIGNEQARLFVRGSGLTPGVSIHFGACCSPVPGDRIVGILEPDKGLTVHTIDCQTLADFADDDSVWQDLQWTPQAEQDAVAAARLRATIRNAPGVLGQVATIIGEAGGNILNLSMAHRQQDFFDVDIDVEVEDARHATMIIAALRANPSVDTVDRARG
jgi:guanosine-3',5'-bis(diphosphate) 3'-pyrophosphohydrolase